MPRTVTLPLAYRDLAPAVVWRAFAGLNAIARPSGHEEAARTWIRGLAAERGLFCQSDAKGNLCVRVPARRARVAEEGAPIVVLQSHLDMVCQKRPGVVHDFAHDPIRPRRDGDWITASGTTLGADNGLGAAMMLAVMESDELIHGPLELLFTVEEETGLWGAAELDPNLVRGRVLINLDSEELDEITIGCAGGAGIDITWPIDTSPGEGGVWVRVGVGGLAGGHSGMQIHEPLANALKVLGQGLEALIEELPSLRLGDFEGGTAHNAIPRDANALLFVPSTDLPALEGALLRAFAPLEAKWRADEPGFGVSHEIVEASAEALSSEATRAVLGLIAVLPHGVRSWSSEFAGKVRTSSNLAQARLERDAQRDSHRVTLHLHVSNRSFAACDLAEVQDECATLAHQAGASTRERDGYPGWEPRADSPLLAQASSSWKSATGREPRVEVVHAGLECGLLARRLPGLDAVSFGPPIKGAHTPEERVSISGVATTWAALTRLLADLSEPV